MRLIDADELRREIARSSIGRNDSKWEAGYVEGRQAALRYIDAAPTVDVPQPLTRDGVLAEVARIEAAGDTAVVEILWPFTGDLRSMPITWVTEWDNPDVPRWNVRVRVVPAVTEWVPLTKLVGRTIKGETKPVGRFLTAINDACRWTSDGTRWHYFPDGTLNLDTGMVLVLAEGER